MLAVFLVSAKKDTSFCIAAPFWAIMVMSTLAGTSCCRTTLKTRLAYAAREPARTAAGVAWTPSPNHSCLHHGAARQCEQVCTAHGLAEDKGRGPPADAPSETWLLPGS